MAKSSKKCRGELSRSAAVNLDCRCVAPCVLGTFTEHWFHAPEPRRRAPGSLDEADDWWATASSAPTPHHLGHRERLRQRALKAMGALPDYELLELFLFRSLPQGDVKLLAKARLERFGGLAAVLAADVEALKTVKGVGGSVALDLKLLQEASLRIGRAEVTKRPVISSWSALLAYTKAALAHAPREQFRVLFLDKKNQLIADETMNEGTVDHAPVYPREVARRALELSASAVILVQPPVGRSDAVGRRHRRDPPGRRGRPRAQDRRPRPPRGRPRGRG
jgi:DNA repair protein RadC